LLAINAKRHKINFFILSAFCSELKKESPTTPLSGAAEKTMSNTLNDEPRPLEWRVGRRTRKERLWAFALAFRSWLLNIRRNTRSTAIKETLVHLRVWLVPATGGAKFFDPQDTSLVNLPCPIAIPQEWASLDAERIDNYAMPVPSISLVPLCQSLIILITEDTVRGKPTLQP